MENGMMIMIVYLTIFCFFSPPSSPHFCSFHSSLLPHSPPFRKKVGLQDITSFQDKKNNKTRQKSSYRGCIRQFNRSKRVPIAGKRLRHTCSHCHKDTKLPTNTQRTWCRPTNAPCLSLS